MAPKSVLFMPMCRFLLLSAAARHFENANNSGYAKDLQDCKPKYRSYKIQTLAQLAAVRDIFSEERACSPSPGNEAKVQTELLKTKATLEKITTDLLSGCLDCVQRRYLWVKTKPEPVCVSDFSQVDGDLDDFANTLEKCHEMNVSSRQQTTSTAAEIGWIVFGIVTAIVVLTFIAFVLKRIFRRKTHRVQQATLETIYRQEEGIEPQGFGVRSSVYNNRPPRDCFVWDGELVKLAPALMAKYNAGDPILKDLTLSEKATKIPKTNHVSEERPGPSREFTNHILIPRLPLVKDKKPSAIDKQKPKSKGSKSSDVSAVITLEDSDDDECKEEMMEQCGQKLANCEETKMGGLFDFTHPNLFFLIILG